MRAVTAVRMALVAVFISMGLAGCSFFPEKVTIERFQGTWVFEEEGERSTLTVDGDGEVQLLNAPAEVFDPGGRDSITHWDRTIDWSHSAPTATGHIYITEGMSRINIEDPSAWNGGQTAYLSNDGTTLSFIVGDIDEDRRVVYTKTDNR